METRTPVHRATIPAREMPKLFEALATVPAEANTRLALYWLICTASRTKETRFATWDEIDGDAWRITEPERMKMRKPHLVPLTRQMREILEAARPLRRSNDRGALIFPGFARDGALSENALLALLARAGFYGRQTSHGFRASFSTWAHEVADANPDVVELCLAHRSNNVRATYNRAEHIPDRRALLQRWNDQLSAWGMVLR